ncbi:hypothetical protein Tco_1474083 [Tanacetum coccineum]
MIGLFKRAKDIFQFLATQNVSAIYSEATDSNKEEEDNDKVKKAGTDDDDDDDDDDGSQISLNAKGSKLLNMSIPCPK